MQARKEQEAKAAREAGFSNYFSGANQHRAAQKDKEQRERSHSKKVVKRTESREKRGWNDRDDYQHESPRENIHRMSADRYSQHSEDDETERSNKVG